MTAFDQFLAYLEKEGFQYDTGFLIATKPVSSEVIGFRMVSGVHQIDLYIRDEFWDASKSHPKLGESQEIAPGLVVSHISK